jgi:hypothetical protein
VNISASAKLWPGPISSMIFSWPAGDSAKSFTWPGHGHVEFIAGLADAKDHLATRQPAHLAAVARRSSSGGLRSLNRGSVAR